MSVADYTLCYSHADGKMHVGRGCSEVQEKLVGEITDEIADVPGYSGDGPCLTLENFSFSTSADIALAVPGGTVIELRGANSLKVVNSSEDANVGVLYSSGDMTINGGDEDSLEVVAETDAGLWSRAICARAGDLIINGGTVTATGGNSKKSCGLYAGGRLWIEIGEKGVIAQNGGKTVTWAKTNAIRAAEDKLIIAPGAEILNAKECLNAEDGWKGSCLSCAEETEPVVISFLK